MADLHRVDGARAPLFDRLVDHEPAQPTEPRPFRVLTRDGLRASVLTEVERLLNTRCPFDRATVAGRERTVLEYGLPDMANYYSENQEDQQLLCNAVREAIEAYEPRLKNVRVTIEAVDRPNQRLALGIHGQLAHGRLLEPVSFPVDLTGLRGEGAR